MERSANTNIVGITYRGIDIKADTVDDLLLQIRLLRRVSGSGLFEFLDPKNCIEVPSSDVTSVLNNFFDIVRLRGRDSI